MSVECKNGCFSKYYIAGNSWSFQWQLKTPFCSSLVHMILHVSVFHSNLSVWKTLAKYRAYSSTYVAANEIRHKIKKSIHVKLWQGNPANLWDLEHFPYWVGVKYVFSAGRSKIIWPTYLLGVRKGLFKLSHFSEGLLLLAFLIRVICPTSGKWVPLVTQTSR